MILFESDLTRRAGELYYSQHRENMASCLHLHNSFELAYVYKGQLMLTVDGSAYTVTEGQAALLFPNQIHGYQRDGYSDAYVCIFPGDLVGDFAKMAQKSRPVSPIFEMEAALADDIAASAGERLLLQSHLYRMLHTFQKTAVYSPHAASGSELTGDIVTRIAARHTEALTLQIIARELGYDHKYLSAVLQKGLHTTFRALLNEYRISHAKELLMRTDSPVEQIAGECGYESLCSFNRNFKALTDTTPSLYRAHQRKKGPSV